MKGGGLVRVAPTQSDPVADSPGYGDDHLHLVGQVAHHCRKSAIESIGPLTVSDVVLRGENPLERRLSVRALCVSGGTILGIRGPNGSGKSSLLGALAGLEKQKPGRIAWGTTPNGSNRQLISYLPSDGIPRWIVDLGRSRLWPRHTAFEEAEQATESLLQANRFRVLEGGNYRRRLNPHHRLWWVANSILADVPWLLLDEPSTGMSAGQRMILVNLLLRHRERGGSVLVASHDTMLLAQVSSRIIDLQAGKIIGECAQ
jgi:ABC-type Mn2+/Zn2+ transport system ATPase subunit